MERLLIKILAQHNEPKNICLPIMSSRFNWVASVRMAELVVDSSSFKDSVLLKLDCFETTESIENFVIT